MPVLRLLSFLPRWSAVPVLLCATALTLLLASGAARAQIVSSVQTVIEAPPGATLVRVRWPATALAIRRAAALLTLRNANGDALAFSLAVAPEDQGLTVRPLWLLVRLDGPGPYQLQVNTAAPGTQATRFVTDPETLTGRRSGYLSDLPLASLRADAWGPVIAALDDAENVQQSNESGWRYIILVLAIAGIVLLAAVIAFFIRHQARRDDVGKL